MTVSYDPQVMQTLAQACQAANEELKHAQSLILSVRSHEDWGCREKDAIDDLMAQCRNIVNSLCEEQNSFLSAVRIVESDLNEAEGKISGLFHSVDDVIAEILSIPVNVFLPNGGGLLGGSTADSLPPLAQWSTGEFHQYLQENPIWANTWKEITMPGPDVYTTPGYKTPDPVLTPAGLGDTWGNVTDVNGTGMEQIPVVAFEDLKL